MNNPSRSRSAALFLLLAGLAPLVVIAGVLVAFVAARRAASPAREVPPPPRPAVSFAQRANNYFTDLPADAYQAPGVAPVTIPDFAGSFAIWAATGRDARGHIWIGASAALVDIPSAHLWEYIPEEKRLIDRGNVVEELKRAGKYRPGEGQMKIHSRIVQAADGYLYFASMDEQGEKEDGSRPPTWGGHLWRLHADTGAWEHLLSAPEALIAVAGMDRHIFALGYFDHIVYHFDCETKRSHSVRVGAVGGHVSRNLLADDRGHVYVPRLRSTGAELVELDSSLKEVAATPLEHYLGEGAPHHSHGIIGFQYLVNRSLVFTTHQGHLYQIQPPADKKPAAVTALGWMHPDGPAYVPSLFTFDGKRHVLGMAHRPDRFDWVVFDLVTGRSRVVPWEAGKGRDGWDLYGSLTRDNEGAFYVGGTQQVMLDGRPRTKPLLVRLGPIK